MHSNPFIREVLELAASGRQRQALDRLKRLQSNAPDDVELHLLVGILSAEVGDTDTARSHLAAVLARQPSPLRRRQRAGRPSCRRTGTPTNRATLWRRYAAAAPGDVRGRIHYIDALLAADDRQAADEQRGRLPLEDAEPGRPSRPGPDLSPGRDRAGLPSTTTGHYPGAESPDDRDARRNYAAALQTLGESGRGHGRSTRRCSPTIPATTWRWSTSAPCARTRTGSIRRTRALSPGHAEPSPATRAGRGRRRSAQHRGRTDDDAAQPAPRTRTARPSCGRRGGGGQAARA